LQKPEPSHGIIRTRDVTVKYSDRSDLSMHRSRE
jgi:hypothetical protein